jgi:hypothetical protein
MTDKKSVFISYAHKDGRAFTKRLADALAVYMDVFWDQNLEAGNFFELLHDEIRGRDYLLYVMTPESLKSEWCRREIDYAKQQSKPIVPARVAHGGGVIDEALAAVYTFADFTSDFDEGFRRTTTMMLGYPFSSWEYLEQLNETGLLDNLQAGKLPGVLALSLAEWIFIAKAYARLTTFIAKSYTSVVLQAEPKSVVGLASTCDLLLEEAVQNNDVVTKILVEDVKETAERYLSQVHTLQERDSEALGVLSASVILDVRKFLRKVAILENNVPDLIAVDNTYIFAVAEKLRELIRTQARHSRYLY